MKLGGKLSGAAVLALAVAGCFTEPGGLDDGGWGHAGAGGSGASGGSGPAGSGGSATAGQPPVAGSGGSGTGGAGTAGRGGSGTGGSGTAGSGGSGAAGTGASGGSGTGGSAGAGGACPSAMACGGDVVGLWTVTSSCLAVKGELDILGFGLGCRTVGVRGSRVVAGSFTANADGTYVDQTTTSGEELLEVPEACLSVSGTVVTCDRLGPVFESLGYDSVTCADDGGGCRCNAVFEQTGGMGVLSLIPASTGRYITSNGTITLLDDNGSTPAAYAYCASADQLTLLPQSSATDAPRGSITLVK